MAACPPGQILPKVPGQVNGRADAANVYSLNRRAVSGYKKRPAQNQKIDTYDNLNKTKGSSWSV